MTGAPATEVSEALQPKLDSEALTLRGRPAPAVRFKRGVVIAIAAVGCVTLVGTVWMAFQPSGGRSADYRGADSQVPVEMPDDALDRLPDTYEDVPKLGPPLPGDLGRPIVRSGRSHGRAAQTAIADPTIDHRAQQRDRRAAARKAALESAIIVRSAKAGSPAGTPTVDERNEPEPVARQATGSSRVPGPHADADRELPGLADVNPHRLQGAASPHMLSAGSVIAASLVTGLRSDLPGLVIAQVTERVYDSATGRTLLIPQGARLVGSYDSTVAFGQKRARIAWQRLIMPDGSSLRIDDMPATDPSGYAGLADQVDFHTRSTLQGAAISTMLSVGSSLSLSGESDLVRAVREAAQQNASRAGDQFVARSLAIQPTITVRPGASVRLVVHRDLVLRPWQE